MTETSHWHHMAYLYKTNALTIAEIVKVYVILDAIGLFGDDKPSKNIGINVFDNSRLNKALVYGVICNLPRDLPVGYNTIGDMLLLHRNTVGKAVKQLIKDGIVTQEDLRPAGSIYTLLKEIEYPNWLMPFTQAIVDIELDKEVHNLAAEYCKDISFQRGWDVLKRELKEKLLPSKDK